MLKMTIYVKEKGILPVTNFEYKGNKEIGSVLRLISKSLLSYDKEYPKDLPLVSTWCGQIINKIEIVQE